MPNGPLLRHPVGKAKAMLDLFMLALGTGFFALFLGYAVLSERL
jgi:hypothetical protein